MRNNAPVEHCGAERLSQWGLKPAIETSRILIYPPLIEAGVFPTEINHLFNKRTQLHINDANKLSSCIAAFFPSGQCVVHEKRASFKDTSS